MGVIMKHYCLNLEVLQGIYCICKKFPSHLINDIQYKSDFFSLTKTADEVSIVCNQGVIPTDMQIDLEKDWNILKVVGPLDFSLVGILSNLSSLLTQASISIFVLSTYDTDYILVRKSSLSEAINALKKGGHTVKCL